MSEPVVRVRVERVGEIHSVSASDRVRSGAMGWT
nr:MAG TPA: hypothetical protein [Caudoviricetes sp.]